MFRYEQPILFKHCDPAGIVFYPRYFEMMNDCVEDFFAEVLRWPFSEIHTSAAVPTAEIRTRFIAPSRLGDQLTLVLRVSLVGRTSCGLTLDAGCSGEQRFATELTLVHVNEMGKPAKWPEVVNTRLATFKESQEP
ncbi:acyl-CoA thioester hydrolase, YbgC/YbaW family [Roseibium album]|nr:acyl-CoA thioester hydrolase, YbgC/YbaW family [Roseibium album]